jgi:hypothetical protein
LAVVLLGADRVQAVFLHPVLLVLDNDSKTTKYDTLLKTQAKMPETTMLENGVCQQVVS